MHVLGIDVGGTKTVCLLADEDGGVIASAREEGANLQGVGELALEKVLHNVMEKTLADTRVLPSAICLGIAGVDRAADEAVVRGIMKRIGYKAKILVVNDALIALQAGIGHEAGIVIVAGTGSIAYGRNTAGETMRAGGWGFAISDEGSGHWIGRAAVTAAMRSLDENGKSPLLERILKTWKLESRDELVVAANATLPPDFATLVPLVLAASDAGDVTACTVLESAGAELARVAKIVISRLFQQEPKPRVAMSGGVFQNSVLVREHFYKSLRSAFAGVVICDDIVDPVRGALELARKGK